ncbi:MAG: flavodoxin [Candidatus Mcinerneyibacterium aminivorans]|uniref:Flavodoxin n=1 Tax=Candidatus Mcinerneyibacterium aminivorans TaxID=2703815 RepID=A0A5D0MJ83_9BACT|nr:MAG: flavodoxin [Candidatus Mcinerneyibacterium aminivorans]
MSLLIIYSTKYGCTEKVANRLANYYRKKYHLINIKKQNFNPDILNEFNSIAIGGSIYAGKIQKEISKFCEDYKDLLLKKKIGLFICCGSEAEIDKYFEKSFISEVLEHAVDKAYMGYEYNFDKMNFLEKMLVKSIAKIKENKSLIKEENIKNLANKLN